jgi:hypothetical protein
LPGLVLAVCFLASGANAQTPSSAAPATAEELAALVLQQFASGTSEEFATVCPDSAAQEVVRRAIKDKAARRANRGRVIWSEAHRAVLLLTGTVVAENSG